MKNLINSLNFENSKKNIIANSITKLIAALSAIVFITNFAFGAPILVTASGGTLTGNYNTLTDAFQSINDGTHKGAILIEINSDIDDGTDQAILNASGVGSSDYTSVLIKPTAIVTLRSNVTVTPDLKGVINLNGANYITIDGRLNGSGDPFALTIKSNDVSNGICLVNAASNNNIKYTNIMEAKRGVFIDGSGNDNNRIEYCKINRNINGIENREGRIFVLHNEIKNFKRYGIIVNGEATIENNSLYIDEPIITTGCEGISVSTLLGHVSIRNNKIYNLTADHSNGFISGISVYTPPVPSIDYATFDIINNFVSLINDEVTGFGLFDMYGIKVGGEDKTFLHANLINNTIYMGGTATDPTSPSVGILFISHAIVFAVRLYNNIIINERTSDLQLTFKAYINLDGSLGSGAGYNCYWPVGPGFTEPFGFVRNVEFVDKMHGNLHLTESANGDVTLQGHQEVDVPEDIEGQERIFPYRGADELDFPSPVDLASFVSVIINNNVTLKWVTNSENNNSGFEIQRSSENGNWSKINFINGKGNSGSPQNYSYVDRDLLSGKYSYRLKQIDYNGNFEYHNLSGEVVIGIPQNFSMSQNYPNPFNPSTKIAFELPYDSKVSIKLFDISGKDAGTLVNEFRTAGYYTINFKASDLSTGVYFYRINAEGGGKNFVITKKMTLIK